MVKHKSKYSCESVIYFNLGPYIIKENCKFSFYFNKANITPTVLDGGNEIILANWPDDKHIICNVNNDIPVKIPSHPYVPVNRSILCNCRIEAKNNFLLQSLATCHDADSKSVMYFTVTTAIVNDLDSLNNLTDSLKFPILLNRTTYEQTLLISLKLPKLLTAPETLKDFVHQFHHKKEIFYLQERHTDTELELPNKNFFIIPSRLFLIQNMLAETKTSFHALLRTSSGAQLKCIEWQEAYIYFKIMGMLTPENVKLNKI